MCNDRLTCSAGLPAGFAGRPAAFYWIPAKSRRSPQKARGPALHISAFLLLAFTLHAAPVQFTNITKSAGIHFIHFKGANGTSTTLEEAGPGVCVADFDGDGYQDIYFVNGRDLYKRGITTRNALYRNNGDGTFTDVTAQAGVGGKGFGMGATIGDYDNDGNEDIFVTNWNSSILYHNNGDGTFTDVTAKAGVENPHFGTGAAWVDFDRDGKLDLFVGNYLKFDPNAKREYFTAEAFPGPLDYEGTANRLFHNNGDGTFTDV